jgi:hypothetical protein
MENEKKLNILGLIIKLVIAVPALLAGVIVMSSGVNAESPKIEQADFMDSLAFSAVMNLSFITIILAALLIVLFFVVLLVSRPAVAIKSILGIVIAALVFFVLYGIGTTETSESLQFSGSITATQGELDFTHAGIITTLLAITVCGALALFMGYIMKLVRNN